MNCLFIYLLDCYLQQVEVLPQQIRTEKSSVPVNALSDAKSLFVKEVISCTSDF